MFATTLIGNSGRGIQYRQTFDFCNKFAPTGHILLYAIFTKSGTVKESQICFLTQNFTAAALELWLNPQNHSNG